MINKTEQQLDKYQNKYRIASSRADWWNYGWAGAYFITICTKNREHYFGEIKGDKMILSNCGVLADVFWHQMRQHAIDIDLGAFVVMPNHIHGILILNTDNDLLGLGNTAVDTDKSKTEGQKRFRNPGKNTVSSIIGGYKSAVTRHAHRLGFEFDWQSRFDDRIIKHDASYQRINDYIENNVKNWRDDGFFD